MKWQNVKQYLVNLRTKKTHCLQVLGDQAKLKAFHDFYKLHNESLVMVGASYLHIFCQKNNFTAEQLSLYKKGLADFGEFFELAAKEYKTLTENPSADKKDMV